MFVFGHVGIGRAMLGPARSTLPVIWFVVGALLPDLIDKPLYYSHLTAYAVGTRTFGHTGLFLVALAGVSLLTRSRQWTALAIGVATHLFLDGVLDLLKPTPSSLWIALTWPLLHRQFAPSYFGSPFEQLHEVELPAVLLSEVIGALLIVREYRQYRHRRSFGSSRRSNAS